jgi:hypothetical protein
VKIKIIGAAAVALFFFGIVVAVIAFLAAGRPIADVRDFTIHEIAPPSPARGIRNGRSLFDS